MLATNTTMRVNAELYSDSISGMLTKDKIRLFRKNSLITIGEYLFWMETFEDDNNEEAPTLD
jgi:hypothetical protein